MNPVVSPPFLKKKAKQLKKEKGLLQYQALNEAAIFFGYHSYKHYLNILNSTHKQSTTDKESLLKEIELELDASKKVKLAILFMQNFKVPFQDLLNLLSLFQHSEENLQLVCESLKLDDEIKSFLFQDFLTDEGKDEIHFRQPHFIPKEISIRDLTYEITNNLLYVDGNYDLKTQFEFEIDHVNPMSKLPQFKDRALFGSFGITIDNHKKINIVHSDIGEEFDGSFQVMSFR